MLAVHWAFGLAPHMGHRTDNFCFKVSFPDFTTIVFSIGGWSDGQSCSEDRDGFRNGTRAKLAILCAPEKPPDE